MEVADWAISTVLPDKTYLDNTLPDIGRFSIYQQVLNNDDKQVFQSLCWYDLPVCLHHMQNPSH